MADCMCGHTADEHDERSHECQVDDCPCFYYEADEDAQD